MFFSKNHKPASATTNKNRKTRRLNMEGLENRDLMSVSSLALSGGVLTLWADNNSTSAEVRKSGSNYVVKEVGTGRQWSYATSGVNLVQFVGGNGNDRFVDYVSNLPVKCWGGGGNDYLEGYNAADYLDGGAGDDILKGYGGNDLMFGGGGNDTLLGMDGNDQLVGDYSRASYTDGNDHLNGGAGQDWLWGGGGDDTLITVDNGTSDYAEGGTGRDTIWVDKNGSTTDSVYGNTASDKTNAIKFFSNGADRTLNGDNIADPTTGLTSQKTRFTGISLFGTNGPSASDIRQGSVGDCYMLAGLSAIAQDNQNGVRQNVVDFDDGTYGVQFGGKFYRVDSELPTIDGNVIFAKLGNPSNQSMWVPIVEKAFAHYRTGANTYESISGGWANEIFRAWNGTGVGNKNLNTYANATALANDMYSRWLSGDLCLGILDTGGVSNVIGGHEYTVYGFNRNSAGRITGIILRNPWGYDGAGSDSNTGDALVTVTPAQIFSMRGALDYGRV